MNKINYYRVEVTDPANPGILGREKKYEAVTFNVVAENDKYVAIDDRRFTSLSKEKSKYETCLDSPEISLHANDRCWGTRVSYTLYTEKTKRAATIKREIEAAVAKKYGFFTRGFDLSFITDGDKA